MRKQRRRAASRYERLRRVALVTAGKSLASDFDKRGALRCYAAFVHSLVPSGQLSFARPNTGTVLTFVSLARKHRVALFACGAVQLCPSIVFFPSRPRFIKRDVSTWPRATTLK
jgi:hypothetical protein